MIDFVHLRQRGPRRPLQLHQLVLYLFDEFWEFVFETLTSFADERDIRPNTLDIVKSFISLFLPTAKLPVALPEKNCRHRAEISDKEGGSRTCSVFGLLRLFQQVRRILDSLFDLAMLRSEFIQK